MFNIECSCPFCGRTHYVVVPADGWYAYVNGALVQDAFPTLTATQREQLISNMCPSCQSNFFEDDYDDDYDDYDDSDLECGFDPYEGCYTFDC